MPKVNFCKPLNNEEILNDKQNIYYDTDTNQRNKNFIQLYDNANNYILQLIETNQTASKIFLFLARYAENNNTIDVSIKELSNIFKCTELTIKRAIKTLKEINFLTTIKVGKKNIYFLNPLVVYNNKAQFKQKLLNTYRDYAGTTEIKLIINNEIINTEEIEIFKKREKLTYRFKLNFKEFQEPGIDEIIEDLNQKELINTEIKELEDKLKLLKSQIETEEKILKLQEEGKETITFEDLCHDFDEDDYF